VSWDNTSSIAFLKTLKLGVPDLQNELFQIILIKRFFFFNDSNFSTAQSPGPGNHGNSASQAEGDEKYRNTTTKYRI